MSGAGVGETAWQRTGECSGCGACCTHLRLQVPPSYASDPDVKHWIELHGIQIVQIGVVTYASIPTPCSALNSDGNCGLYGQPSRPRLCAAYPATPEALAGVEDQCSFDFIPIGEITNMTSWKNVHTGKSYPMQKGTNGPDDKNHGTTHKPAPMPKSGK
jgi:hypothetical protein